MTLAYFALGTTLANLTNIETTVSTTPAHVLPANRVPLAGPIRRVTLDRKVQRTGSIDVALQWDIMKTSELDALIRAYWTDYTTITVSLYVTAIDETGYYSPFSVNLERPYQGDNYNLDNGTWARNITANGLNWVLQSATKNSNATITTGERLVYGDTSSSNVTLTLPAANAPNANTVFSFQKTSASNTLTIQRAGADTLAGGTSIALTANNARIDIVSDGVSAWSRVYA